GEDEVQIRGAPLLELLEEPLERDGATGLRRQLLAPQPLAPGLRELPGGALVFDNPRELAGGRRMIEAEDLDRRPRARLLDLLAAIVVEGAHPAPRLPAHHPAPPPHRSP